MERQGLGTRSWELRVKDSRLGIGGSGFGTLLGLAILVMRSATVFAAASGSGGETDLGITVWVYDYAHVGRSTLIAAEAQAAFIFGKVGLTMRWSNVTTDSAESLVDSSSDQPAGPTTLNLRIVPRIKAEPGATTDSTMGFAWGNLATVSYHWGKAADSKGNAMSGDILACVIAHEIGHLLLGPNSHSPTGIMKGKWSAEELRGAGWGRLRFTPQQGELIRAEVLARSGERQASTAQMAASQPPPTAPRRSAAVQ